jgi:hypothetical protein
MKDAFECVMGKNSTVLAARENYAVGKKSTVGVASESSTVGVASKNSRARSASEDRSETSTVCAASENCKNITVQVGLMLNAVLADTDLEMPNVELVKSLQFCVPSVAIRLCRRYCVVHMSVIVVTGLRERGLPLDNWRCVSAQHRDWLVTKPLAFFCKCETGETSNPYSPVNAIRFGGYVSPFVLVFLSVPFSLFTFNSIVTSLSATTSTPTLPQIPTASAAAFRQSTGQKSA